MATTDINPRNTTVPPRTEDRTNYNALWIVLALALLAALAFAWYSSDTTDEPYATSATARTSDEYSTDTTRSNTMTTPGSPDMTRTSTTPAPTSDTSY